MLDDGTPADALRAFELLSKVTSSPQNRYPGKRVRRPDYHTTVVTASYDRSVKDRG